MKAVFIPLARKTFFLESAEKNLVASRKTLTEIFPDIVMPEGLLYEPSEVSSFLETVSAPDLVIYQCATFIGAEFMYEVLRRYDCPVVIWAVREPSMDGGRLKFNSLTGAFSAGNSCHVRGQKYSFVFGNPEEDSVKAQLTSIQKAGKLVCDLRDLTIGIVGSQPDGFGFGSLDATELVSAFGTRLAHIEAATIMQRALAYQESDLAGELEELRKKTKGADAIPKENLVKYARLRRAFGEYVKESGIGALASRCWPDFFTGFGAPVCAVLSMLNDIGVPSSCEADVGGALSMYMGTTMTDSPVYFGDPVAIDTENDAIVFWHCGAGASSLARKDKGAALGVHPNRKIGPTMEFGLKDGAVTVLRLGHDRQGYRLFVMKGDALDAPQKFFGTSVTVRPAGGKPEEVVASAVEAGWEPHYVVAYGDIKDALIAWAKMAGIRVMCYGSTGKDDM